MSKKERITVQDIADALSLSRNTVSKALNGQYVPPRTRERVLSAAIEMGYKSYASVASTQEEQRHRRIVLITSKHLMTMTFFIHVVRGIELALDEAQNIELLQFTTTKSSFFDRLVEYLHENEVDGIICMELFSADYVPRLISLGYPTVFFDFPIYLSVMGNYDIVMPESFSSIKNLCLTLIRERGIRHFGFIGDYTHCTSFYERFLAMREAIFLAGLEYNADYSFIEKDSFPYGDPEELKKALADMPLPEYFICANDTIAAAVINALGLLHKKVPRDILVSGFDNLPESKKCEPPLTTFNVDKTGLGKKLLEGSARSHCASAPEDADYLPAIQAYPAPDDVIYTISYSYKLKKIRQNTLRGKDLANEKYTINQIFEILRNSDRHEGIKLLYLYH